MTARSLTLLLAEIVGGAAVRESVGEAGRRPLLERCHHRLQRVLDAAGGRPLARSHLGLQAVLPHPEAACAAAQEMQQRIAALALASGQPLALRVAVHAAPPGPAVDEPDPLALADGERMLALAAPGETVISTVILLHLSDPLASGWELLPSGDLPGLVLYHRPSPLPTPAPGPASLAVPPGSGERLCLRHRDQIRIVDARHPTLTIGRDPGSMLVIGDHRVSRQHARIERRDHDHYLIDRSTNGSFVRVEGGREMLLRHAELLLAGSGSICLGASGNDPGAPRIDFVHVV